MFLREIISLEVMFLRKFSRCYRFFALFTVLLIIFGITACSGQKKPQTQTTAQQDEKEAPKELDKLKKSIDKIEKELTAIYEDNKKPLFMQEQQAQSKGGQKQQDQGSGSEGQGQEEQSDGGSSGSSGSQKQSQTQELSPEKLQEKLMQEKYKKLDDMQKDVIALHTAWNSYEPKALSDLVQQTAIDEFEMTLNTLTEAVTKHDVYLGMLEVNQLKKYLPDFYSLYKEKYPPDIDRVRYGAKKIELLTDNKDYEGAGKVIIYLDTVWASAKPKMKKDNLEQINKFDLALADLKKALAGKNDTVIEAKTEVIMKIMDEIEKASKK